MPYYSYNNQDITIDILMKLEEVVRILAGILNKPFDEVLGMVYLSKTFAALKNTECCMWAESSQFIADEYLREKNITPNVSQHSEKHCVNDFQQAKR